MKQATRFWTVAGIALVFTYLFFLEYLPPFKRVSIPYDLRDFHYPLTNYAFQAIRNGRFPEWDPTIYCGLSFVGNIQAALFYPPTWFLFAINVGRQAISYQSLQDFVFLHVWLAFLLCYVWLSHRGLEKLACVLSAGVFAYSGYMLNQLQHLGLVTGWTWIPLALWGIDQASEQREWRPLWKVVVASALCFLAGYPPTWFVFAVCTLSYAAWQWRTSLGVILALGASLAVAAVQLLPAAEATAMKAFEPRYGTGWRNPEAYVSYFLPNYFDFGLHHMPSGHWGGDYLYLGAPAFVGLIALAGRQRRRELLPALTVLAASLVMATNPFNLVWSVIRHSDLLAQICRDWYFLAGLTLAAALLTAFGLDHYLKQERKPAPRWMVVVTIGLLTGWPVRELLVWFPPGADFPSGWKSAIAPSVTLALAALGMYLLPAERGVFRTVLVTALLLTIGVDYKVSGTSKWFDAREGSGGITYGWFPDVDDSAFSQLRAESQYRIALDVTAPFPPELRHYGLTTPQGFDPMVTTRYKELMERNEHFRSSFEIDMDPANKAALDLLGVRFFLTSEGGPLFSRLSQDPEFRLLLPATRRLKVFEYMKALPPYGWVSSGEGQTAQSVQWEPEVRQFIVRSESGGRFALAEQAAPGWRATVDGKSVGIENWRGAFQAAQVPPGQHLVVFRFQSSALRTGGLVSLLATTLMVWLFTKRRRIRS